MVLVPLNGRITLNGFTGDAIFRTEQWFSTISRKLVEGLEIRRVNIEGREYSEVQAVITLGSEYQRVNVPMLIFDEVSDLLNDSCFFYVCTEEDEIGATCPFDVILGNDFLYEVGLSMDFRERILSGSFGEIPFGDEMTRFVPKSYEMANYETDPDERVILLLDMDCFEVQVHEKPEQRGKPRVVVNGKRIVAVSYEAKALGINRSTTPYLTEAKQIYPDLIAIEIPRRRNCMSRVDTSIAREATAKIVRAIRSTLEELDPTGTLTIFEFSSSDEFYVDVTGLVNRIEEMDPRHGLLIEIQNSELWPNTFLYNGVVQGDPTKDYIFRRLRTLVNKRSLHLDHLEVQEIRLIYGSTIASEIIKNILYRTQLQSSVGIGSKKLISKLASGLHKPGSVTILAPSGFHKFSNVIRVSDVPGMGSKIGEFVQNEFDISTMSELQEIPDYVLAGCSVQQEGRRSFKFLGMEKARKILNCAHGICDKPVVPATCFKTSGVNRKLDGEIYMIHEITKILKEQLEEFLEKMEFEKRENSRIPKKIKISINLKNEATVGSTIEVKAGQELGTVEDFYKYFVSKHLTYWNWNSNSKVKEVDMMANF